jgi:hypothetical protein
MSEWNKNGDKLFLSLCETMKEVAWMKLQQMTTHRPQNMNREITGRMGRNERETDK